MQIYLKHPEHGYKIAEITPEADSDKKNGWIEVTKDGYYDRGQKEDIKGTEEESKQEASSENVTDIGAPGKKRGRPAKNRLIDEHS